MSILAQADLGVVLGAEEYAEQVAYCQSALSQLVRQVLTHKRPVVIVFEGWDAAAQADAIKHLVEKLDPRGYVVHSCVSPEGDDTARHYFYRFWRRLPERGHLAIFDGSWYQRVLADRIEGLCVEAEWKRTYREIDEFERQLVDFGTIVIKFWLHISPDEQFRRLQEGGGLAAGDGRSFSKRGLYEAAVEEMLLKTSTLLAPWTIVEAHDARWAQVKVFRTVVEALSAALNPVLEDGAGKPGEMGQREARAPAKSGREERDKKVKAKAKTDTP